MKDLAYFHRCITTTLLSAALCSCVVVPKQVGSYDTKCKVATKKIELTMEQIDSFHGLSCSNHDCNIDLVGEIMSSALLTTASAIVSGSIALTGNTLYWLEKQGDCPKTQEQNKSEPMQQPADNEYLLTEEIITAKS